MKIAENIYLYILTLLGILLILFVSFREGLTNMSNTKNNSNKQIVLIGDSILNNANYVPLNKSVADILKTKSANIFNYAKDNATISDCYNQLDTIQSNLNTNNTNIFISAGGNNILREHRSLTKIELTNLFNTYMEFIKALRVKLGNAKINILNLYTPSNPKYQIYKPTIELWNQLLVDNSSKIGEIYNVIHLDTLLYKPEDFVSDYEPSAKASQKIANLLELSSV